MLRIIGGLLTAGGYLILLVLMTGLALVHVGFIAFVWIAGLLFGLGAGALEWVIAEQRRCRQQEEERRRAREAREAAHRLNEVENGFADLALDNLRRETERAIQREKQRRRRQAQGQARVAL